MRDELEQQVMGLARQRDSLAEELASMSATQQEVLALRAALQHEAEAGSQQQNDRWARRYSLFAIVKLLVLRLMLSLSTSLIPH